MSRPFRLGLSGSSFLYAMPPEIVVPAYRQRITGRQGKFDERQNRVMVEFTRAMMRVFNTMQIDAMEHYHSTAWDNDLILPMLLSDPQCEFWSVHAPYGRYIDPASPEPESREGALAEYCDAVEVAKRLGAGVVVAHPGANTQFDVPKRARLELAAQTLTRIADYAGECGVKIAVEPLPKNEPGNTLDEVLWIIERIDRPNVGVNFDVNHLYPPEDVPELIRKAGNLILNVHISDQDGQERHWLPFMGRIDWKSVLEALSSVGYEGPLIYETHWGDAKGCEDVGRLVVENYKRLIAL